MKKILEEYFGKKSKIMGFLLKIRESGYMDRQGSISDGLGHSRTGLKRNEMMGRMGNMGIMGKMIKMEVL